MMDLLNLSSNLPVTQPVTEATTDEINRQLVGEFKSAAKLVTSLYHSKDKDLTSQNQHFSKAAKSVASLYRLGCSGSAMSHLNGYVKCLDDLVQVILEGGDVENWALSRRAEILNGRIDEPVQTSDKPMEQNFNNSGENCGNDEEAASVLDAVDTELTDDFYIPQDHEFTFSKEFMVQHHFRPSYPPLSITHNQRQRSAWKQKKEKEIKREPKKEKELDDDRRRKYDRKERKDRN